MHQATKRLIFLGILWFFPLSAIGAGSKASSAIPDRREFPVSRSTSACENFYDYACKEAIAGFELREDRSKHVFSFSDSSERLLEAKKKFLLQLPSRKNLSERAKALSTVFQACMNESASAKEEKQTVKQLVDQVQKLKSRGEFLKFAASQMEKAEYSFVDWGATSNLEDSDWQDIFFLADVQTLPERSYYAKPEVVADFKSLVKKAFESIGLDKAEERAKWVVDFEAEFSKTYPVPAEIRELFNTKTGISRKQLLKDVPNFYLQSFLDRVPARTHLRNLTPANFAFLNSALEKQPLEVLQSVYLYHAVSPYLDDAYPEYFKQSFEFGKKHLGGPNVRPVRQERCTMYVMGKFTRELDAEVLPEIFPDFPEAKFIGLVEKVRSSIIHGIETNQWLSAQSKKAAVKKIRVASLQLVKPRNDAEWNFNPPGEYQLDTPYANNRTLEIHLMEKELKELSTVRDRSRWEMGPLTVNAYYSPSDNKFVMPIGILQYPFYDPILPDSTNLGAVGMVVGHELGHGVDDHGARYDSTGRMKQWMTNADIKEFQKRGQRLVKQFDQSGHNGTLTLGENIGDLVGLTFAYQAAFPKDEGTTEAKKNFFLQYARAWCGVIRPKYREMLIKTDPHAQMEARVNEQVKHQAAFQQAFGCKEGDPMVLPTVERVRIW